MTARARLLWYLVAALSFVLIAMVLIGYGALILSADMTFISAGIVCVYALATVWLGVAIHMRPRPGTPVQGTPVQGTPVQGTPVQQTPVQQTPGQGTPGRGAPAQGGPTQVGPVRGDPVGEDPVGPALFWCRYLADQMPVAGLAGTLIGLAMLFGLSGESGEAATLSALGTAIYSTLAGIVCSAALHLQTVLADARA